MNLHQERWETLHADDGHAITLLSWLPPGPPRAVVQIAHGMGEHAERYRRLALTLNDAGFAVAANQHRGHGEAARKDGTLADFGPGGFAAVAEDMALVTRTLRARHPGLPLILLGHSMGSFAAQLYALKHAELLAGLALSGTAATDLLATGRGPDRKLEDSNRGIAEARTPFDWLSRDEAEVDKYIADPLCGFTMNKPSLVSMFSDCAATTLPGAFAALPSDLPVYLFTGDQDPVNNKLAWFHPLVRRLREAGLKRISTRVWPGARHEVLNETNRVQVTAELLAWINSVLEGSATAFDNTD